MMKYALLITLAVALSGCDQAPRQSPCECKLHGGCMVTWQKRAVDRYSDGTIESDYDPWGFYIGPDKNVPNECRKPRP